MSVVARLAWSQPAGERGQERPWRELNRDVSRARLSVSPLAPEFDCIKNRSKKSTPGTARPRACPMPHRTRVPRQRTVDRTNDTRQTQAATSISCAQ